MPAGGQTRIRQVAAVTSAPGPVNFPAGCATCTSRIRADYLGLYEIPPASFPATVKLLSRTFRG